MSPNIPEELDWVKIRAACTLASVFETLVNGAKEDVARINLARGDKFGITRNGAYVSVYQKDEGAGRRSVALNCTESSIRAESQGKVLEAAIMVNDEGKCCLKVDGKERKVWQFRKDALEELFFGDGWFR